MTTTMVPELFLNFSMVDNATEVWNTTDAQPGGGGGGGGGRTLPTYYEWLVPMFIGIIMVVGLVGNGLVIYVILRADKRTVTNYYIVSLAATDVVFLIICSPLTALYYTQHPFVFGQFMCKLFNFIQPVSSQVTILLLTAMSADRFQAIVRPLKSLKTRTVKTAVIVSCFIWLVSMLLNIPQLMYSKIFHVIYRGSLQPYCGLFYPSPEFKRVFTLYTFICAFAVPLIIIIICYSSMIRHLWQRVVPMDALSGPAKAAHAERNLRQKRKITWMVLTVVLVFAVCWFPFHIFYMWLQFGSSFSYTLAAYNFKIAAHVMSFANSATNPFIYAFLGEKFRRSFRKAFPCCFKMSASFAESTAQGVSGTQTGHQTAGTTRMAAVTHHTRMDTFAAK